ncbi:oxidoreductase [Skermanella stibiiresistens SB22]|uniref:Oxidoreductase n=1 Tax=Skermanella stibiiresistens SB22 TaxID=1385369 RepID=W9HF53_9PROT|nr:SDR family oxidoreductase [Skermanella stibiiresistens]EWY42533.1 oxidoreductase [Skermanella stibiiresistens SB22]
MPHTSKPLTDRCAIITGAGQGLGAVIARQYVAAGASVLLCARGGDSLRAVQEQLSSDLAPGQRVLIQTADVAVPDQVDALVARAGAEFPRIDILVNNAGVYGPLGAIEEIDWEEWVTAIQINLMGTVYPCRAVVPHMRVAGYGKIVNLSGGGATSPLPRVSAYAASKAAVVRFTETLALEVADARIDVNSIAPGALATRLMDQVVDAGPDRVGASFHARMVRIRDEGGAPLEKGADLCVYLGSAASDGISGRLLAAVWDPWATLHERAEDLAKSDIYTLRRITPEDRGQNWDGQ